VPELNPRVPEEGAKINPIENDVVAYVPVDYSGKSDKSKIVRTAPAPQRKTWSGKVDGSFFQFQPAQPLWYYSDDFLYNTLDRLLALDTNTGFWKPLLLDENGALIVTSQGTVTADVTIVGVNIPAQVTPLTVDGTVTADAGAGWDASGLAIENGGHLQNIDVYVVSIDSMLSSIAATDGQPATGNFFQVGGTDGVNAHTISTDSSGRVNTNATISGTVTVVQPTASNLNAQVQGNVPNGSVDSGNPIKIGGVVASSPGVALSPGDRVDANFDSIGRLSTVTSFTPLSSPTNSAVSVSSTSTTILSSSAARTGFIITNNSTQIVYIQFGATATVASSLPLYRGDSITIASPSIYTGVVSGIVASGTADVRVVSFA